MHNDNDHLDLLEDAPGLQSVCAADACWKVLIVDDDEDVHHATEFALHDLRVLGVVLVPGGLVPLALRADLEPGLSEPSPQPPSAQPPASSAT